MTLLVGITLRVSLVVVLALTGSLFLRRRSAAVRHWILAVGMAAALLMPVMERTAPKWSVPLESLGVDQVTFAPSVMRLAAVPRSEVVPAIPEPLAKPAASSDVARILMVTWIAGAAIGLLLLSGALLRLAQIASRCEPIIAPVWIDQLHDISVRFGLDRPVLLLQSGHPSLLVTWGVWRPEIILPIGAGGWSDDRIRVVLSHELSHIRRADWAWQLAAGMLRAFYWFNPLVWIACSRLRHESEQACDDDVLGLGVTGPDYATHLLNVARAVQHRAWVPALGMARPSSLQRRVCAMLNTKIDRSPLPRSRRIVIGLAVLVMAVAVAGSDVAAQAGATLSGSFVDALNNAIPNVTLTLIGNATGDKYTVRSDTDGRCTFEGLPDGDYRGEVNAPGYTDTHPFVRIVNGKSTRPTVIPLSLGSVEEDIVVTSATTQTVMTPAAAQAAALARAQAFRQHDPNAAILPPMKTRDVRPLYPSNRTDDESTVFLEGIIDTNGQLKGLQILQPADSDFGHAAFDAVNQWQFEATRLHGVPVDTVMHVTVRFVR